MFCSVLIAQSAEDEVRKAGDENIRAILSGDAAALQRQYTDDYYRTGDNGKVIGKAEFIHIVSSSNRRPSNIELLERKIRVYGDTAVETGISNGTSERNGQSEVHEDRYTVVWRKHNGVWQKAVYQATTLAPAPAQASQ